MEPMNVKYEYAEIERYLARGRVLHAQNMVSLVRKLVRALTAKRPAAETGFPGHAKPI